MTTPEQTLAEINDIAAFLIKAEQAAKQGEHINLKGIDNRITSICLQAQAANHEDQQRFLPELNTLLNLLNSYENTVRDLAAVQTEPAST